MRMSCTGLPVVSMQLLVHRVLRTAPADRPCLSCGPHRRIAEDIGPGGGGGLLEGRKEGAGAARRGCRRSQGPPRRRRRQLLSQAVL